MIIKLLNSVKTGGKLNFPGSIIEVNEKEAANLVNIRVAEYYGNEVVNTELNIDVLIEEFSSIPGIRDSVAKGIIDAGITSIEQLSEMSIEDLVSLDVKGLKDKLASKIVEYFSVDEDSDDSDDSDELDFETIDEL